MPELAWLSPLDWYAVDVAATAVFQEMEAEHWRAMWDGEDSGSDTTAADMLANRRERAQGREAERAAYASSEQRPITEHGITPEGVRWEAVDRTGTFRADGGLRGSEIPPWEQ